MSSMLKRIGVLVAGLIGLAVIALVIVYVVAGSRMDKAYDIAVEAVVIPTDADAIAHGEHVAVTRGCADCHADNYGGGPFIEDPVIGTLPATNLTAGQGGTGAYGDEDWVRALRHGVGVDGKPLLYMPSYEFYYLGDEDLGALIAYLKTLPAVDNETPDPSIAAPGRLLYVAGQLPLVSAEIIDHEAPRPVAPEPGVTAEYGRYLAYGCIGCHGDDFKGGPIPGVPPDWPPAADVTQAGNPGSWSEENFIEAMRTGVTPEGTEMNGEYMPWPNIAQATDEEIKALWAFLETLPGG